MSPLLVTFAGEATGQWEVDRIEPVVGEALPSVSHVAVLEGRAARPPREATWILRGSTGHERYVTRSERELLEAVQQPLGRHEATRPALVVRRFERWWGLPQEERREIIEERSHHIATGLRHLPAVARRLHHSRELGEPFDFLTWFEYAPADADFERLAAGLRETEEWSYVEREVDIRLGRIDGEEQR